MSPLLRSRNSDTRFATRLIAAVAVGIVTYVADRLLLAGVLSAGFAGGPLHPVRARFNFLDYRLLDFWQWVVITSAGALVLFLVLGSRFTRLAAIAWFASAVALAILSSIVGDLNWTIPLSIALTGAVFLWINRLARRAA